MPDNFIIIIHETNLSHHHPTVAAAPEVYTVIPPQPTEKKPGQLEQWQLEEFFNKGFVKVPKFFTKEELHPVIKVT